MGLAVGTAKYLLFFFNFVFFITGIVIIAVGAVVLNEVRTYKETLKDVEFVSAPVLLIVVGVFVAVIAFFGCCGAIKHNYCMLMTFAALLTLIFILELAAGIAAYVRRDDIKGEIKKAMTDSLKEYGKTNTTTTFWDELQKDNKCCGVSNVTDWTLAGLSIPESCCEKPGNVTKMCDPLKPDYYKPGCLTWLEEFFTKHINKIGAVGVGIAFIQILGIVFACCLASAVKDSH